MDDTKKMLRTIINGQSAMKSELLTKIDKLSMKIDGVEKNLGGRMDGLEEKIDGVEKRLAKRIDKLGLQIANLEDDTPTVEEFDNLEKRVSKLEHKAIAV